MSKPTGDRDDLDKGIEALRERLDMLAAADRHEIGHIAIALSLAYEALTCIMRRLDALEARLEAQLEATARFAREEEARRRAGEEREPRP